eukprot:8721291-Lingulodinium_polyedra.AAC.1
MRTPKLAFARSARGVRFASRCGGKRTTRWHHCARFLTRTMMRSHRPCDVATARKLHARALHADTFFDVRMVRACDL